MKKLALLITIILFASSCSIRNIRSNVMLSTKSIQGVKVIAPVKAEYCNYQLLVIPIVGDPADLYEELMEEATAVGGNTVLDFQVRNKDVLFVYPFFLQSCWEAVGNAALIE